MKVKFTRDEWYPFYVETPTGYLGDEYEMSEETLARYREAVRTLSVIFDELNKQHDDHQAQTR